MLFGKEARLFCISRFYGLHYTCRPNGELKGQNMLPYWTLKNIAMLTICYVSIRYLQVYRLSFIGAFTKSRKATFTFVIYVCPRVTTHLPLDLFSFFPKNLSRVFKFHWKWTKMAGTLHEDLFTLMIISRWIILRMRNIAGKRCRERQNKFFVQQLFLENHAFYAIMWEKHGTAGLATDDNMAHSYYLPDNKGRNTDTHTQNVY